RPRARRGAGDVARRRERACEAARIGLSRVMQLPLPQILRRRLIRPFGTGPWRYVRRPELLRRHTLVTPLRSGAETFPAMLAAIRAAQSSIHFEIYILRADRVGEAFRDALVERARAGVAVRLLYDAVGSIGLAD